MHQRNASLSRILRSASIFSFAGPANPPALARLLCLPTQLGGSGEMNVLASTLNALMSNASVDATSNPALSGLVAIPRPLGAATESTTDTEAQNVATVSGDEVATPGTG